jgi:hypothetical protein
MLGTTLFIDELGILQNVVTRPLSLLLSTPMAEAQVAPPLFLLMEKVCLVVFGSSELSLRLPALLASLVALLLMWSVARRVLDEPLVPLAVLTFAVGFTFVYYSNQVKQYASDVTITLLVLRLALSLCCTAPLSLSFWVGAALAGLVLPFYSQASMMVFAGCGAVLVLLAYFDPGRPRLHATVGVVAGWAVGCALSLALAQATLHPTTRAFMQNWWLDGMLPLNAQLPIVFARILAERWANGLGWPHPASIWVVFTVVGGILLWREQRKVALLLLAPWLVSGLASVLKQYPLRWRLMDFLLPIMILLLFVGFQGVVRWVRRRSQRLSVALLVVCTVPILYSTTRGNLPPYCQHDAKSLFSQLAQVRRPGDAVYAYYGAGQYLRWYGPQYGLSPASYHLGHCYLYTPGAERNYLTEVDAFRGQPRVWIVMIAHNEFEFKSLTRYLDAIGRRGARLIAPDQLPDEAGNFMDSYAQLYDLSDAKRAARFSAATFPLFPAPPKQANKIYWSCYGPQVIAENKY